MGCSKIKFEDKASALREAHNQMYCRRKRPKQNRKGARAKNNRKLSVYECRVCGSWHLTTQSNKRKY